MNEKNTKGGLGFFSILTLIFTTLKLTNTGAVAGWSWWWVLSPLWLPVVLIITIAVIFAFVIVMYRLFTDKQ